MPLVEIDLDPSAAPIPDDVAQLIADAQRQIITLDDERPASIPAFVPSDFELVYRALAAIDAAHLTAGCRFLEWGSGIGVVTCMADLIGFDAVGVEIEPQLVNVARSLARAHHIATQFVQGSFVPRGFEPRLRSPDDVTWLSTSGLAGYRELELDPDDFDIVFAYPWPGEKQTIFDLFDDCGAVGALLLTYHGQEGIRLQRKVKQ
jgi:hypothetical protein